jgi:hypothetical protein
MIFIVAHLQVVVVVVVIVVVVVEKLFSTDD